MRTIELEDDVYAHIASHTAEIGESATSILRRLLGMPRSGQADGPRSLDPLHEFAELLAEPMFSGATSAVSRMLRIFREAFTQKGQKFDAVLSIQGRDRAYFAKSEEEITRSGTHTQPREIEGTGYWVMTNSPTRQKQQMVREVLAMLGYSNAAVSAAVGVIR